MFYTIKPFLQVLLAHIKIFSILTCIIFTCLRRVEGLLSLRHALICLYNILARELMYMNC